jgi:divalent metal cation (Fe/Co/Zn/Cd) transporter
MDELFNPNLLYSKLIIITFIELLILVAILSLKRAYKEKLKILVPLNISSNLFGLSLLVLFGLVLLTVNFFIYQYSFLTLMILTAVIISILYIEMGIILSRNFFVKFFDDQLPKEIIYFIGFILMINAGYFTIMFILKIIKANSLI